MIKHKKIVTQKIIKTALYAYALVCKHEEVLYLNLDAKLLNDVLMLL